MEYGKTCIEKAETDRIRMTNNFGDGRCSRAIEYSVRKVFPKPVRRVQEIILLSDC